MAFDCITVDPDEMGGVPSIRGLRVPVATLVGAEVLAEAGRDAPHVRDLGMQAATEEEILEVAISEGRAIISADTDFGTIFSR